MTRSKNILICPLEWGLGHAGRVIPLAMELYKRGAEIYLAAGEEHLSFLRQEFPMGKYILFPGFKPTYSRHLPAYLSIFLKIPQLIYRIIKEHGDLKRIIESHNIDIVISDNRFGLWNRRVKTVYITHQVWIKLPRWVRFTEPLISLVHRCVIARYDMCFIPDLPDENNLTGVLSHKIPLPKNALFVGLLSRFTTDSDSSSTTLHDEGGEVYDIVVLSGPEPQKSILRDSLLPIIKRLGTRVFILGGEPGRVGEVMDDANIRYYNHLPSREMRQLIDGSRHIIARAGYTTIMELTSLGRSALLIPTPGQPEQEYLIEYLLGKSLFTRRVQGDTTYISNDDFIELSDAGNLVAESKSLLNRALDLLLEE